jgi:hypothetical protein
MGTRRFRPAIAAIVLAAISLCGVPLSAVSPQSAAVRLPDTPQGALATEYLRIFNGGDESAMLTFVRERMTAAARARRTEDERRKTFQQVRERLGNIEVAEVTIAEPGRLEFVVKARNGLLATFTLNFDAGTPPRVDAISIEVHGTPVADTQVGFKPMWSPPSGGPRSG